MASPARRIRQTATAVLEPVQPVLGQNVPIVPSPSLIASAARYPGKVARIYSTVKEWQKEAYRHYEICGEARYAANYFGHSMSKAALYVAESARKDAPTLESGPAFDALADLFNGAEGQAQMLAAVGKHLTIAGECYLVGRNIEILDAFNEPTGDTADIWEVLSCLEVGNAGGTWTIKSVEEGKPDILLTDDDVVVRIWRPHPAHRMEADSPFRSLLPILREIEWLTMHIFAQCSSRLAGAGILFVSQGIDIPPPLDDNGKPKTFANEAEGMMWALAQGMMRAHNDPSSPERLVPLVASVPEEVMENGKITELVHFWTELDSEAKGMRQDAVHRFAVGMDLAPEQVEGMSTGASTGGGNSNGPNHWGMWQTKEETITIHIEPMLELVVNALTVGFLRPASGGQLEVVRYSTEGLRIRPDRSKESVVLWQAGALKTAVMLAENGFNPDTDMPDEDERKQFLLWKIAGGSATPEQVAAAAATYGIALPSAAPEQPRESRPDPSLEDVPTRDLPEFPTAASWDRLSVLVLATEPLVYHALQRVGNRLRSSVAQPPTCRAYEAHTLIKANGSTKKLMDDAFPSAALTLQGIADAEAVVPVLESYVATLLNEQAPHQRDRLAKFLKAASL